MFEHKIQMKNIKKEDNIIEYNKKNGNVIWELEEYEIQIRKILIFSSECITFP